MADIRLIEAERIATECGYMLFPGRCDRRIGPEAFCNFPLMETKAQRMPFCVFCFRDQQQVDRTRNLLERLERGFVVRHVGPEIYVEQRNVA